MRARRMVVAAALAVPLAACGDGAATDPPPAEPGPAAQLAFRTPPPQVAEGQVPLGPVEVAVQDADGNLVTGAMAVVTLALAASPSGEALGGSSTASAVGGIATFTDLRLALPGDGFVLEASSGTLTPATSAPFAVRLTFVQETVGLDHTCAVTIAAFGYCWGSNTFGRLGDGTTAPRATPTPVAGALSFAQVSAGLEHTCGVTTDNLAYCWGANLFGQLGDDSTEPRATPTPVADDLRFAQVSAGARHTCGVTTDDVAYCWGSNFRGQLGDDGSTEEPRETPAAVAGTLRFARVSAGASHTCGVTIGGFAYCWGFNARGQLGDGSTTQSEIPKEVPLFNDLRFARVSAGAEHTCAVTTGNVAYCWGYNANGRLGDGTTTQHESPTPVAGTLRFARVSAGSFHTCGVTTGDVAYCWGFNSSGQLGDGTMEQHETPTSVASDGRSFARVSAGHAHTCGVTLDNVAYCWGVNSSGQLGDGSTNNRFTPARVVQ